MYDIMYYMISYMISYIQLLYKQPREIIRNRFTSKQLYEKSKTFASSNYLNHSYSITEFGTEMSKILKQFKKRTATGVMFMKLM